MSLEQIPWLLTMALLVLGSAFFSASEAALFFLTRQDVRVLTSGNRAQQIAARLLESPDRLLTAVLFWNLAMNITYFALASMLSIRLEQAGQQAAAGEVAIGSLLLVIFFGELLPKSLAVIRPRLLATLVAVPLAAAVRLLDPVLPLFRVAVLLSQRAIWPRFLPEPYLELADLERAIELSTTDAALVEQEKTVLKNIVSLSEMRVDELMRPRSALETLHPPLSLRDLEGRLPPSGYILVTEPDSDEVAAAIPLGALSHLRDDHLERYAEEVIYVPWCAIAGETLDLLRSRDRSVAAVVNELGETIGIVTLEDILDTVLHHGASRSQRLLHQPPIVPTGPDAWRVNGMATLRRLSRQLGVPLPPTRAVTVAGMVQERLERLPRPGDTCRWGPFSFEVLEVPEHGQLIVAMTRSSSDEGGQSS